MDTPARFATRSAPNAITSGRQLSEPARQAIRCMRDGYVAWLAEGEGEGAIRFRGCIDVNGDVHLRYELDRVGDIDAAELSSRTRNHLERPWSDLRSIGASLILDVEVVPSAEFEFQGEMGSLRFQQGMFGTRTLEGRALPWLERTLGLEGTSRGQRRRRLTRKLWALLDNAQ